MTSHVKDLFVLAERPNWLAGLQESVRSWLMREQVWKANIVGQVAPKAGERILDLACGSGELCLMLHQACPEAEVIGLDFDRDALRMARAGARAAGVALSFWHGTADKPLNVPMCHRASFDKIVVNLFFPQLTIERKRSALAQAAALLHSGGAIFVCDW